VYQPVLLVIGYVGAAEEPVGAFESRLANLVRAALKQAVDFF